MSALDAALPRLARMKAAVVAHPGKIGDVTRARALVADVASRWDGGEIDWYETTVDDPGPGQARAALDAGAEIVVAWGGDGTVMAVAGVLEGTDAALGIMPGGTGNLLARHLGIPLTAPEALAVALEGTTRRIDLMDVYLGKGVHRRSAVMCGMGWDAAMMGAPEELKRRLRWGAYVVQGAKTLRQRPMKLRLSVDGGPERHLHGHTVLVANIGTLVAGLQLLPEAQIDDGMLDVLVIDPSNPVDWLRTTAGVVRGTAAEHDPSRIHFTGREVVISTGTSRPRQVDGDLVDNGYGFRVTVLPDALAVRVPASGSSRRAEEKSS